MTWGADLSVVASALLLKGFVQAFACYSPKNKPVPAFWIEKMYNPLSRALAGWLEMDIV